MKTDTFKSNVRQKVFHTNQTAVSSQPDWTCDADERCRFSLFLIPLYCKQVNLHILDIVIYMYYDVWYVRVRVVKKNVFAGLNISDIFKYHHASPL